MSRAGVIQIIEGKEGFVPSLVRAFFYLLSLGFRALRKVTNWLADTGLLKPHELSLPVISVGNIVAGGTGKTPLIAFLGKALEGAAIISRGYCSAHERGHAKVNREGSSEEFGDEPLLLARDFPVYIGKNRYRSAIRAEKEGARRLLLDDGMQQRWVRADLQIAVLKGKDPFGRGHFLPRGYLRDSPKRLKNVDLIVVNGEGDLKPVKAVTEAPIVRVMPRVLGVYNSHGDEISLEGKRVGTFCAIGDPEGFRATVANLGAEVVGALCEADHAPFRPGQIEQFEKNLSIEYLVCTEKDWVKLKNPKEHWLFVRIELTVIEGKKEMEAFLHQARQLEKKSEGGKT